MTCPTEFKCSLFAEGELPEAEARDVALHLETCEKCDQLVSALRGESRMLVQCLQDIDSDFLDVPEFSTASPRAIGVVGFGFGVIAIALAFRLSTALLFGLQLPVEVQWVNLRDWLLNMGVAINAGLYAIQNADAMVTGAVQTTGWLTIGVALIVMARVLKRNTAVSSLLAVLVVIGFSSSPSYAIDLRKGEAASIPKTETVDDSLLVAPDEKARSIDIAGTVKGDLFAVGDVVTISGTVEGNVFAGARRVEVSGTIGGSLIGAAQTVSISGRVGRNLIAAGGVFNVSRSGEIGGNSISASSEAVIEGKTARDVIGAGGMFDLRGDVGRDVRFAGGQVTLSPTAHVGGDLQARVGKEESVQVATGAVIGGKKDIIINRAAPRRSSYLTVSFYIWQIVRIIAAFITGLILFKLIPSLVPLRISTGMDWLKAGGIGFIALVTVPVAFIILAITVIGLPIALISLVLWAVSLYLAKIVVAEFVGRSVMKSRGAVPLLAGLILVVVAINLPWIGGLINFLLILAGMGAIAVLGYNAAVQPRPAEI